MDRRARINYVDVVMLFGSLVALVAVAPWLFTFVEDIQAVADPFTSVLIGFVPAMLIIGLIVSAGVSARGR
jgi:hypothetical protein